MVLAKPNLSARTVALGLAGAVRRLGAATCMVGGSIALEVDGPTGGRWRLDLDVPGGAFHEDDRADARTTLRATPEAMVALLVAPEQIPRLCAAGSLAVDGEVDRLCRLATRLKQTRSWLDRG